jgi:hypothetical protein
MYQFTNVKVSQHKRLESINHPLWIDAMVRLIGNDKYFRWHDSGDIQSMEHLLKIFAVCNATPNTSHWIPTREKALISRYMKSGGIIPDNVVIRLSAAMIDQAAVRLPGVNSSTVHDTGAPIGQACPASNQDGECRDCRACWNKEVLNVSYARH